MATLDKVRPLVGVKAACRELAVSARDLVPDSKCRGLFPDRVQLHREAHGFFQSFF
jgi:hypothetical protein